MPGRPPGKGVRLDEPFEGAVVSRWPGVAIGAVGVISDRRESGAPSWVGFPAVFVLAWLARVLAGNGLFIDYGVE